MRRILCIWLPNWPVQRLLVARPELLRADFVLYETVRGSRRVARCSSQAKALGIAVGMPLAEAMAIAPEMRLERLELDRPGLEELADACRQFSPLVGVEDAAAPESLFLDITGLEHLFGSERAIGEKVLQEFSRRGFSARVAIADTLGAAWAVAHFGNHGDAARPIVVPSGETESALAPLPIEALRLPGETVELLRSLGIHRAGQLGFLPRKEISARFGANLLERWDQATGRRPEPVPAQAVNEQFQAQQDLEYPTASREVLELIVERLILQVAQSLLRSGRGAMRLACRFRCETPQRRDKNEAIGAEADVGLFRPSASPRHLFQLLRMRLERLAIPAPVLTVSVEAPVTAPLERRQEELFDLDFDTAGRKCRRLLAALVDRLTSRLGAQSVLRAHRVPDAQPELAYRYDALVETSYQRLLCRGAGRLAAAWDSPPRPLRLLRQPVPLTVVSLLPSSTRIGGFHFRGQEHRVTHVWGPERIETGWWRGPMVARDYYRVEVVAGQRFWLFRRLADGSWFLHGTFE